MLLMFSFILKTIHVVEINEYESQVVKRKCGQIIAEFIIHLQSLTLPL